MLLLLLKASRVGLGSRLKAFFQAAISLSSWPTPAPAPQGTLLGIWEQPGLSHSYAQGRRILTGWLAGWLAGRQSSYTARFQPIVASCCS